MFDTKRTSQVIREARIRKNMTQVKLADAMGVSYQAVSNWERGGSMPDIGKLGELCEVLDLKLETLLGNEKDAGTVQRVMDGQAPATREALCDAAPILPPQQLKTYAQEMKNREDMDPHTLLSLAPFLDEEMLDMLAEQCCEDIGIHEVMSLAPFLSEKALDHLAERCCGEAGIHELSGLAPFLSQETLDRLVENCCEDIGMQGLSGLAPFLSQKALDHLVEQFGEQDPGALMRLAPFLSGDTLGKLAVQMKAAGRNDWQSLVPFLPKSALRNLLFE